MIADGDVWVWGRLAGEGFTINQFEPRRLEVIRKDGLWIRKVVCGYNHLALMVDQGSVHSYRLLKM